MAEQYNFQRKCINIYSFNFFFFLKSALIPVISFDNSLSFIFAILQPEVFRVLYFIKQKS